MTTKLDGFSAANLKLMLSLRVSNQENLIFERPTRELDQCDAAVNKSIPYSEVVHFETIIPLTYSCFSSVTAR
jgi:hypothetical protein